MPLLVLGLVSCVAWFLSMLAGTGSPLILIPLVNLFCGSAAVAPVLTLGMMLGNGQRVLLFRHRIDWSVTQWYLPGAIAGAILGAYGFSLIQLDWLQWLLALALIAIAWSQWKKPERSSTRTSQKKKLAIKAWYFLPFAFFNGVGSALIGSTGPILNPAYIGYGLLKEDMVATKAFHNAVLHLAKIAAYLYFGTLHGEHWVYGLVIGAAALPGNWLGRRVLARMSPDQFRQVVLAFVAFSGIVMLGRRLALVL